MHMKSISQVLILILTVSTSLVACNQSPTNRDSDPLKNYNGLKNDKPGKIEKDQTIGAAEDDGTPTACSKKYSFSITDSDGNAVKSKLEFLVGEAKSYMINLTSTT